MAYPAVKRRKKKTKSKRGEKETLPLFPVDYGDDGPQEYMEITSVEFCYELLRVHGMRKPILMHGYVYFKLRFYSMCSTFVVIIVNYFFLWFILFYCLLCKHSFKTNPNSVY